ncbi:MAG: bifunctional 2-polyprenyl-6-hydroxyphenol methylase/3-demethylubiquinol 3-O-methyltransferase UbiG [Desulfobacterales bacterium]
MTGNADPREIARFAAQADSWWDPAGPFRALHAINDLRLAFIAARTPLSGRTVLDVGCGGGILAEALARRGAHVTGIDLSPEAVAAARRHAAAAGLAIDYRVGTAESLAAGGGPRFDAVTCMELLEHVPRPAEVVQACGVLVRPGGDVFFATLNRHPQSFLFAIVGAEWVLGLVARGTHRYRKFVRPAELRDFCRRAGLEPGDTCGLHYHPFRRRFRPGGHTRVNYMLHARRPAAPEATAEARDR